MLPVRDIPLEESTNADPATWPEAERGPATATASGIDTADVAGTLCPMLRRAIAWGTHCAPLIAPDQIDFFRERFIRSLLSQYAFDRAAQHDAHASVDASGWAFDAPVADEGALSPQTALPGPAPYLPGS